MFNKCQFHFRTVKFEIKANWANYSSRAILLKTNEFNIYKKWKPTTD